MVRLIAGLLFFGLVICLLIGIIPMNLWSIGAVVLCMIVALKG
jgi:hypothetical protein